MYVYYNPNPESHDTGDCVIRALSKALGYDWDRTYAELCFEGFLKKNWGNYDTVWQPYLMAKGFKRYIIPDTCPDCYTVADFSRDNPQGTFVLATGTHVIAVIDGDIYDSWDSSDLVPIYFFHKEV